MKFDEARRKFLKIITSPFALVGVVGGYLSGKFIMSEESGKKTITYSLAGSPLGIGDVKDLGSVFLVRDREGIFALRARCTHLGCKPIWNGKIFHCPCHGSEFTMEGDVIHGPATRHLEALLIKKEGDKLIIYLNRDAPFTQRVRVG